MGLPAATFFHVDVFATGPLTGNGLAVFLGAGGWAAPFMQRLTREMNQFESIFLAEPTAQGEAGARVFTVDEELPFAGHPVLGAAAVLHRAFAPGDAERDWLLKLAAGDLPVRTARLPQGQYRAEMNQGTGELGEAIDTALLAPVLDGLGLRRDDLVDGLPARVVSTGLPYLILPVRPGALARGVAQSASVEALIAPFGAKFSLLLDAEGREQRTWDHLGRVEDVATGSAAGPAAAYLFDLGLADPALPLTLSQGRFAGRPSRIGVHRDCAGRLWVSGEVWPVSRGVLDLQPETSA